MSRVRSVFLGTPEFAVTCLKALLDDDHFEIVGVVTQPDRPSGRKMLLSPSPVKSFALARQLRVMSPESINRDLILQEVQKWGAEVAIVVAFGQIVSQKFLDSFRFGAVNVHASLLPRWRGAAPIQRALEAGDSTTGVALQKMVKALDAGDVLGSRQCAITPEMDAQSLHDHLAVLGADLLKIELMDYVRGNLAAQPQDPNLVTYAKKLDKSEAQIDWKQSAKNLNLKIRAFVMGPGTWTTLAGKKIKIHKTEVAPLSSEGRSPGEVLQTLPELIVATGEGSLRLLELQPESRTRMSPVDFLKGHPMKTGDCFGH